jgi:hypothetical protein
MKRYDRELRAAGFAGSTADFYRAVGEAFWHVHPGRTYEWLAREPDLAKAFCDQVRQRLGRDLNDRLIMGALENGRKQNIKAEH